MLARIFGKKKGGGDEKKNGDKKSVNEMNADMLPAEQEDPIESIIRSLHAKSAQGPKVCSYYLKD